MIRSPRSLTRLASALVVLAGLATAGAALADTWNAPNNSGLQHFKIGNSTQQFLVYYGYENTVAGDATWTGAEAVDSTTDFIARTFTVNNCPVLGGSARPTLVNANVGDIRVDWDSYTDGQIAEGTRGVLRIAGEDTAQAITRTEIQAGRPRPNTARNYHPNGWYWQEELSGIGFGVEFQGDTLFAGIFSCTAAGKPTWHITTGTMTSNALYEGRLQKWSKPNGVVTSEDLGPVTMTFFLANELFPETRRINVTLPPSLARGTMTLKPYSR